MVKTINLQINLTNKVFYSLVTIFIVLILGVSIWAYNSGKSPSVFGHSGEEIEVTINGEIKNLNEALNEIINLNMQQIESYACGGYYRHFGTGYSDVWGCTIENYKKALDQNNLNADLCPSETQTVVSSFYNSGGKWKNHYLCIVGDVEIASTNYIGARI